MAGELDTFFFHLADTREGKDLVSARVGEDRSVPTFEPVQASRFVQDSGAGTQVEVVRITQDNLRVDVVQQVTFVHTFDGAHGPHGHEDRRQDVAMVRVDDACAGGTPAVSMFQGEVLAHSLLSTGKMIWGLKPLASSGVMRA